MRKQAGLICLFTGILAILGLFLRRTQLNTAFEPQTGLHTSGSTVSIILLLLCIVYAVALIFFVRRFKGREISTEFRVALRGNTVLYPVLSVAFGVVIIVGAIMVLKESGTLKYPGMINTSAILAILTGLCLPLIAMGPKKDGRSNVICAATLLPVVFSCIWLVTSFKFWAADPVAWNYAFEILAISAVTMSFYYLSGYAFDVPKPMGLIYFSQLAAFFSIITLADSRLLGWNLIFGAVAAFSISASAVIIKNYN